MIVRASARLFAFIGDPVAQGMMPGRLNAFLAEAGIDAVMVPMHVPAPAVGALLDNLAQLGNYDGSIVTIPHKAVAFEWAARRTSRAEACGVANILFRDDGDAWAADNLDGLGMLGALQAVGFDASGARALVIGCGGAGAAIAASLAERGAGRLKLTDVDPAKAERLAGRLRRCFPGIATEAGAADPAGCNLVVNATPLGMADGDPMVCDPATFEPGTVAADAVARTDGTRFLREARRQGHRTADGLAMVEHQMDHVCRLFGLPPWPESGASAPG